MAATPQQRAMAGQVAAWTRWNQEPDRAAATKPAREGMLRKFEREVDPEGVLSPDERRAKAIAARRIHMKRLALASSKARSASAKAAKPKRRRATVQPNDEAQGAA